MSNNSGWNANQLISLLNGETKAKWSYLFDAELAMWHHYMALRQPDVAGGCGWLGRRERETT